MFVGPLLLLHYERHGDIALATRIIFAVEHKLIGAGRCGHPV
jgi:hypothetical protein